MPGRINVKDAPYNAKGDALMVLDASLTSGSPIVTSAAANFQPGDVGKAIFANDRFSGNTFLPQTTIISRQSATQVTVAVNALATIANQALVWGTDDTSAFQAAYAAAVAGMSTAVYGVSPSRIEVPDSSYFISGRIYNNVTGGADSITGPSLVGDGKTATTFMVSPNTTIPGDGSGVLIQNIGYGSRFADFGVFGCYKMFPLQTGQDIIRFIQASSFTVDNVTMGAFGSFNAGNAFAVRSCGAIKISQLTVQGGSSLSTSTNAMTAMLFSGAGGVLQQCFPSNFPRNLVVTNNEGRGPLTTPLIWDGGGIDEGGFACEIVNGGNLNLVGAFVYSSLVPGQETAIHVDGTSKLWLTMCSAGRFGAAVGKALTIDAGGQVYSSKTTYRGTSPTLKFVENHGDFFDQGGNDYRLYSDSTTYVAKRPAQCFNGRLPRRE